MRGTPPSGTARDIATATGGELVDTADAVPANPYASATAANLAAAGMDLSALPVEQLVALLPERQHRVTAEIRGI